MANTYLKRLNIKKMKSKTTRRYHLHMIDPGIAIKTNKINRETTTLA
jgi:hypothetical protein